MEMLVNAPVLDLHDGQLVTLFDAEGTRIVARRGTVWVTEEGDRADHIVSAGESLVVAHPGRTLVQAMRPARIAIREALRSANDPD